MCTRHQRDGSCRQVHRGDQAVCRIMHGQSFCCYGYALSYLTLTTSLPLFPLFYSRFQMSHGLILLKLPCIPTLMLQMQLSFTMGTVAGFVHCMLSLRLLRTIPSNLGRTSSMRLLRIWNVASGTEELEFKLN